MRKFDPADEDYNLWLFLAQVRSVMLRARQMEVSRYGITASQASVLFVVNALGHKSTPAEISRWLFQEPHSVTGILNRMEKQGLVKRVKDLAKKNHVRVELTEKGREVYADCCKRESMHRIMPSLSGEQRRQLTACLENLRDASLKYLGEEQELPFPY
jgi:DNA-binding MarR family transcriptional regulator